MRDFTNHQTALQLAGEYMATHGGSFRSGEDLGQAFQWLAAQHWKELTEEVSKAPAASPAKTNT
jgi:hypothetical protein